MATTAAAPGWLRVPDDANALAPQVWPERAAPRRRRPPGRSGGVAATELAERFGTPLYVVDEAERAPARHASSPPSAPPRHCGVHGARSTTPARRSSRGAIVRWVTEAGLAVDVCTGGELAVALAAGADPARLGFHGNNKSVAEIERRRRTRRRRDHHRQPRSRSSGVARCRGARRPRAARAPAREQRRARLDARVPRDGARGPEVRRRPRRTPPSRGRPHPRASPRSTSSACTATSARRSSAPPGSPSRPRACSSAARRARYAAAPLPELNLGGGFGIAYTSADDPTPIEEIALGIADAVARGVRARSASPCRSSPSSRAAPSSARPASRSTKSARSSRCDRRRRAPLRQSSTAA